MVATVFKGETLRSMLLNAYGWWKVSQITYIAAIVSFALGGLALIGSLFAPTLGHRPEITHEAIPVQSAQAPATTAVTPRPDHLPEVDARWLAADGQVRTGEVFVPAGAVAGSTVPVWTNRAGQLTGPPLGPTQLASRAQLAAGAAAGSLAVALIAAAWLVRRSLNRRRLAEWDADWLANGPRWSQRR